jgi:hypothetical protein
MTMTTEQDFFRELGHVPELPPWCYEKVSRKIRYRSLTSRAVLAAAALLIVSAGMAGLLSVHKGKDRLVSPEAVEELQTVHNYLTGTDIEKEYESYALYEGEIQE